MANQQIIIVEDEPEIAELIELHVKREGYSTQIIDDGGEALEIIKKSPPDLILLDLMLPGMSGLELCRALRWEEATRELPVIMVTARGEEADVVAGLEVGADDYVTKPFSPRVLIARIRNILRRRNRPVSNLEEVDSSPFFGGRLSIDTDRHEVRIDDQPCDLTVTEFRILQYLCERPGFVRTRHQIIQAVHGATAVLSPRTIDVHITSLRRKLGELGSCIDTIRGVGYRLEELGSVEEE